MTAQPRRGRMPGRGSSLDRTHEQAERPPDRAGGSGAARKKHTAARGDRAAGQVTGAQAERTTLPAFRHDVHTLNRFGVAPTSVRTPWMFGLQRSLVRRCECEML